MSKDNSYDFNQAVTEGTNIGRELYEAHVLDLMKGRNGATAPSGAKGIAFEVMANDKDNLAHLGTSVTKMTKNPRATQVDAVRMKTNKVVGRMQYKDAPKSVSKIMKQVEQKKYWQSTLVGTTETAQKFNEIAEKKGIAKKMVDSGISGKTTHRIGDKNIGRFISSEGLGDVMRVSAEISFLTCAVIEGVKQLGEADSAGEYIGKVTTKSAECAVASAITAAASEFGYSSAAALLKALGMGCGVVIPATIISAAIVLVAGGFISEVTDGAFEEIGDWIGETLNDVLDDCKFNADRMRYECEVAGDMILDAVEDFACGCECVCNEIKLKLDERREYNDLKNELTWDQLLSGDLGGAITTWFDLPFVL